MTQPYSEFVRYRSCERKRRHDTVTDANRAVLAHWARGEWAWRYRCRYCGGWHVTGEREAT